MDSGTVHKMISDNGVMGNGDVTAYGKVNNDAHEIFV